MCGVGGGEAVGGGRGFALHRQALLCTAVYQTKLRTSHQGELAEAAPGPHCPVGLLYDTG